MVKKLLFGSERPTRRIIFFLTPFWILLASVCISVFGIDFAISQEWNRVSMKAVAVLSLILFISFYILVFPTNPSMRKKGIKYLLEMFFGSALFFSLIGCFAWVSLSQLGGFGASRIIGENKSIILKYQKYNQRICNHFLLATRQGIVIKKTSSFAGLRLCIPLDIYRDPELSHIEINGYDSWFGFAVLGYKIKSD